MTTGCMYSGACGCPSACDRARMPRAAAMYALSLSLALSLRARACAPVHALVTSSRPPLRADSTFWRFCAVSQVIWELCCALPACLRPLPLPCIAACMCFQFQSHSMHLSCLTAPRLLAYLALARSSASCAYLLLPQRDRTAVTSAQKLVSCVCIPILPRA